MKNEDDRSLHSSFFTLHSSFRVAVAAIKHEANTFAPRLTTPADFERKGLWRGRELLERSAGTNDELAGFHAVTEREGIELLPLFRAYAQPLGRVERAAYERFKRDLLDGLRAAGQLDGVLLSLHGAMAVVDEDDPDGDLLAAVRALVGPDVPLVSSHDLHANITRQMCRAATALVGFHTSPHVDLEDTGRRAAEVLMGVLRGATRPTMACRKVPMITPAEKHRSEFGTYGELFRLVDEIERRPSILSASLFTVQPWLDVEELGWTAVVVTDGDAELAERTAAELGEAAWSRREELLVELVPLADAIERARRAPRGPIVFVDSADSTNSGATGDSTAILEAVLDQSVGGTVLLHVVDAEAAAAAHAAGVGREITLAVGGKVDTVHYRPVRLTATVDALSDGRYTVESPMMRGQAVNVGRAAALRTGQLRLVVCEAWPPGHDPGIYRHLGLDPRDAKVVQIKSPAGFRAWYEPIAAEIILLDTPGLTPANLAALPFRRAPRPLFPLDR